MKRGPSLVKLEFVVSCDPLAQHRANRVVLLVFE